MYIRTKDGIYEVKKVETLCGVKFYDYETREDFVNRIREEQINKSSEDPSELCDSLMFVDNDEEKDFLITEMNKDNLNYYDPKEETCYACLKIELPNGAIRIEPVAKFIYEKWEWELL
jgi:hypothetical protein